MRALGLIVFVVFVSLGAAYAILWLGCELTSIFGMACGHNAPVTLVAILVVVALTLGVAAAVRSAMRTSLDESNTRKRGSLAP